MAKKKNPKAKKGKVYYEVKCSEDEVLVVDAKNKKDAWKKAFKVFYDVRHSHCTITERDPKEYRSR